MKEARVCAYRDESFIMKTIIVYGKLQRTGVGARRTYEGKKFAESNKSIYGVMLTVV